MPAGTETSCSVSNYLLGLILRQIKRSVYRRVLSPTQEQRSNSYGPIFYNLLMYNRPSCIRLPHTSRVFVCFF